MDATAGETTKPNEPNVTAKDIVVRGMPGFRGIKLPMMGTLATTYYPIADDGFLHFPPNAMLHATIANELLRSEEKAAQTLSERVRAEEMKKNSMGRLEDAITKAVGGQADLAMQVTATVMSLMPEMMRQMREQLEADRANSSGSGSGKGKNA